MINSEIDFVIKTATLIEWQKWLNQWTHTYNKIEIIKSEIHGENSITIILKRTK